MSTIQRILTGLEFIVDPPTGCISWPVETQNLIRLSMELARATRSGLAFAAVGRLPEEECDCRDVDSWLAEAESQLEQLTHSESMLGLPLEDGAWMGEPLAEWAHSARDSAMDLLIVPGGSEGRPSKQIEGELQLPHLAACPVWFAGWEPDRLDDGPPLIAICDDLSERAFTQLLFAVELALVWNARLLVVHPVSRNAALLTADEEDQLRRDIFARLSRTDFRALSHGSQLRILSGDLADILNQISQVQVPNLVMASTKLAAADRPVWRGHLLLWPEQGNPPQP